MLFKGTLHIEIMIIFFVFRYRVENSRDCVVRRLEKERERASELIQLVREIEREREREKHIYFFS